MERHTNLKRVFRNYFMDQTKCARHTPIYAQKEWRESFSKHDKEIQIYVTLEKVRLMCCASTSAKPMTGFFESHNGF
jgi:hypothetical protein